MTSLRAIFAPTLPRVSTLWVLTALSFALVVLALAWSAVDQRLLSDVPVWLKPLKFSLSFVVFFATLALVERRLSPAWRQGWVLRLTTGVMGAAMILEMAYIFAMAAQQQASHFNFSTPFTTALYNLMGLGAVLLIAGVALFGVVVLRDKQASFSPFLRWSIGWGFILSFVMTLITAGYMGSEGTLVGVQGPGAPTLPLLGWSGSVGDIRPAHFLALHAMQALPLIGLWVERKGYSLRALGLAALAYVLLTAAVFAQALAGLPLIVL